MHELMDKTPQQQITEAREKISNLLNQVLPQNEQMQAAKIISEIPIKIEEAIKNPKQKFCEQKYGEITVLKALSGDYKGITELLNKIPGIINRNFNELPVVIKMVYEFCEQEGLNPTIKVVGETTRLEGYFEHTVRVPAYVEITIDIF